MCRACANWCCESEEPDECGCNGCLEEKCWSEMQQRRYDAWFDIAVAQPRKKRETQTIELDPKPDTSSI